MSGPIRRGTLLVALAPMVVHFATACGYDQDDDSRFAPRAAAEARVHSCLPVAGGFEMDVSVTAKEVRATFHCRSSGSFGCSSTDDPNDCSSSSREFGPQWGTEVLADRIPVRALQVQACDYVDGTSRCRAASPEMPPSTTLFVPADGSPCVVLLAKARLSSGEESEATTAACCYPAASPAGNDGGADGVVSAPSGAFALGAVDGSHR